MSTCPADPLVRRDGTLRKHRRPALVPGTVASADCAGADQRPEPTPVPLWIAEAFR